MKSYKTTVTMKDVADACNVSISTVSLVLSNDERIPMSTRKKVLSVVREFGYRPNVMARNLSKQTAMTIACVVPYESYVTEPATVNEMVKAIYEATSTIGYRLTFEMVTPQFILRRFYSRMFKERSIDSMIVVSPSLSDKFLLELEPFKNSVILFGSTLENATLFSIAPDNVRGGFLATEHLIRLGHKKIGFLSVSPNFSWVKERMEGHKQAMNESGLHLDEKLLVAVNYKYGVSLSDTLKEMRHQGMTALFASSDQLALESMASLKQIGCSVPNDVSVIGMDGITACTYSDPPLTTIAVPFKAMATNAVQSLTLKRERAESLQKFLKRLGKEQIASQPFKEVVEVDLIERSSCRKTA